MDFRNALKELRRVLKNEGKIMALEPNGSNPVLRASRAINRNFLHIDSTSSETLHSTENYVREFAGSGFNDITIRYFSFDSMTKMRWKNTALRLLAMCKFGAQKLSRMLPEKFGSEYVMQHFGNKKFRFIYGDILDFELLKKSMEGSEFVFHLAANADIRKGLEDTKRDLMHNTFGTYNVIEAMRLNGIKKIAFASSAAVYGEPDKHPTPEDCPLISTSFYGASKSAGENLIESFCDAFGFQTWIYRFVSVVGERYTHGCVYDFIKKLNSNPKELEILGDGTQRKSYVYIADCVDAMFHVIKHADKKVNIYNIGTDYFLNVKEIAED